MQLNFDFSGVQTYKRYDTTIDSINIFKAGALSQDVLLLEESKIVELMKKWKETEEYNKQCEKENISIYKVAFDELTQFCNVMEIKTHKKSKYGKIIGEYAEFKFLMGKLKEKIPVYCPYSKPFPHEIYVNGEKHRNCFSPCTILDVYKLGKRIVESTKKKDVKNDKMLVASIKFLVEHGISFDCNDSKNIINTANELAKTKYIDTNFVDGVEMEIKFCDDCDSWIIGERRCSCGNRRISLVVEGDLIDGFHGYAEPY